MEATASVERQRPVTWELASTIDGQRRELQAKTEEAGTESAWAWQVEAWPHQQVQATPFESFGSFESFAGTTRCHEWLERKDAGERKEGPDSAVLRALEMTSRIHKQKRSQAIPILKNVSLNSLRTQRDESNHSQVQAQELIISHHSSATPRGLIISHHSSLSNPEKNEETLIRQNYPDLTAQLPIFNLRKNRFRIGTYNLRGLKRFGRQAEISHLLKTSNLDIMGLQETKTTGNTITTLAEGILINSSSDPFPNREEHRGTGLVIRKSLANTLHKLYQGSSRWCGALFLSTPVPLLILSVYAPTAATDPDEKTQFYEQVGNIITDNGGAYLIILGDFNAKILHNPGLPENVGTNFFPKYRPPTRPPARSSRKL